jgi:hypothetical protein
MSGLIQLFQKDSHVLAGMHVVVICRCVNSTQPARRSRAFRVGIGGPHFSALAAVSAFFASAVAYMSARCAEGFRERHPTGSLFLAHLGSELVAFAGHLAARLGVALLLQQKILANVVSPD